MTPRHAATSLDNKVASSPFAKTAEQEAMKDAELAGQVGWWLRLTTNYIRHEKLGDGDFDPIAERLFLCEAELRFPKPTPDSHLRGFYLNEQGKTAGKQILSKAKIVTLSAAELAARQVDPRHTQVDGLDHDVTVMVDVIVGIDGHVWKATAKNPPTERVGRSSLRVGQDDRPCRDHRIVPPPARTANLRRLSAASAQHRFRHTLVRARRRRACSSAQRSSATPGELELTIWLARSLHAVPSARLQSGDLCGAQSCSLAISSHHLQRLSG